MLISIGIWAASTYPKTEVPPDLSPETVREIELEHSLAGRVGKAIEPVIRPLGYDWQIAF